MLRKWLGRLTRLKSFCACFGLIQTKTSESHRPKNFSAPSLPIEVGRSVRIGFVDPDSDREDRDFSVGRTSRTPPEQDGVG